MMVLLIIACTDKNYCYVSLNVKDIFLESLIKRQFRDTTLITDYLFYTLCFFQLPLLSRAIGLLVILCTAAEASEFLNTRSSPRLNYKPSQQRSSLKTSQFVEVGEYLKHSRTGGNTEISPTNLGTKKDRILYVIGSLAKLIRRAQTEPKTGRRTPRLFVNKADAMAYIATASSMLGDNSTPGEMASFISEISNLAGAIQSIQSESASSTADFVTAINEAAESHNANTNELVNSLISDMQQHQQNSLFTQASHSPSRPASSQPSFPQSSNPLFPSQQLSSTNSNPTATNSALGKLLSIVVGTILVVLSFF